MGVVRNQATFNTIISFAGLFLGALNILFLYRIYFTLEEFGLVNLLVSITLVFSQISALGTVNTIIRFFPFFETKDNIHHGFVNWVTLISLIGFALLTLFYILFRPAIESAFIENSPIYIEYYYVIIPLAGFTLLFNLFEAIARAIHRTVYSAFLKDVLLRLLTTAGILLVGFKMITFDDFVLFFVFINFLIALLVFLQLAFSGRLKFNLDFTSIPFPKVKEFFGYGLFSLLAFSAYYITLNMYRIMIGSLVSIDIVGIYSIFLFVATVIAFPTRAISRIIVPIIADAWKKNDTEKIHSLYKKTSLIQLILALWIFIGIWANEHNILTVLNKPEYYGYFNIFIFLGISFLIDATGSINSDILSTSVKFKFDTLFNILFLFTGVLLNFIFIPVYGGVGAAVATAVAMFVFNIGKWFYIKHQFGMQPFGIKHIYVVAIGVITVLVGINLPIIGNFIVDVLYRSILVTILFIGSIYLFKFSDDLNDYVSLLLVKAKLKR
mgnify:CR=1 FL=1